MRDVEHRVLSQNISWSFEFTHPVKDVWPHISDTDRINKMAGVPPVDYTHEPSGQGGSTRFGEYRFAGMLLRWKEAPYEWVENNFFRVERDYSAGPLKKLDILWKVEPTSSGCKLTQTVSFEGKNKFLSWFSAFQISFQLKRGFLKAYAQIQKYIDLKTVPTMPAGSSLKADASAEQIQELKTKLQKIGFTALESGTMTEFIYRSTPADLYHIRPFHLANQWSMDRLQALSLFLKATDAGIFSLSWDILCPRCQGPKENSSSLRSLKDKAHCDACNIQFDAHFDKSVELTFCINPNVRNVILGDFCVGGPQKTPHYVTQVNLAKGETKKISVKLHAGGHLIRSLQSTKAWTASVEDSPSADSAARSKTFIFDDNAQDDDTLQNLIWSHKHPLELTFVNKMDHPIAVTIENASMGDEVCTASLVTSLQEFRNRFSSEVLMPGQQIGVSAMAIMFTDLKSSTNLYNRVGDAAAYRLVRDHFEILIKCVSEHEGAIVKTIGDAVMATFINPANALKAAFDIHKHISEPLSLKIGIHFGPCFVVNLNDRLDYFGQTVNIASRTESQCEGGDITITETLMSEGAVKEVVRAAGYPTLKITRALKGFDNQFELYRIECKPSVIKSVKQA